MCFYEYNKIARRFRIFPRTTCSAFKVRCIIIVIVIITPISSRIIIIIVITECESATFFGDFRKIWCLDFYFFAQNILENFENDSLWSRKQKKTNFHFSISIFEKSKSKFFETKIEKFFKISRMIKLWNTCSITTDSKWFNHHSFIAPSFESNSKTETKSVLKLAVFHNEIFSFSGRSKSTKIPKFMAHKNKKSRWTWPKNIRDRIFSTKRPCI